jgi:hypothetical protein
MPPQAPFSDVPRHAGGHFVLMIYAAIYRLLNHIRRLGDASTGSSLEEVFERYPFLAEYFEEMREQMPDDLTWAAATVWWEKSIREWEQSCTAHLPLRALANQAGLEFRQLLAFMFIGLIEEDSRFGTIAAELQQPLESRRPTVELAGQIMIDEPLVGESDAWSICRRLLQVGVVEVTRPDGPRSEWQLRVPTLIWDVARGQWDETPARWLRCHRRDEFPLHEQLIAPPDVIEQLQRIPNVIDVGKARVIVIRSAPGSNAFELMGAVARERGQDVAVVDQPASVDEETFRLLGPFCGMAGCWPILIYEAAPGESITVPPLSGYDGPVGLLMGQEGGLRGALAEQALTVVLPHDGPELRERHWRRALNGRSIRELTSIVDNFQFGGAYIRKVAHIAAAQAGLEGRQDIWPEDVRRAGRTLNRQLLDTLATPLDSSGSWNRLVVSSSTSEKLGELFRRCRHRERMLPRLGPAFGRNSNRGVRALFTGASGTGKTYGARILAAELGMDLYRVDLAAVINKYIGETEKNLHLVLTRAEALDVVLLLDEGDALLGNRTEVRSANDRYANLETNYLLQRLENYQGIVLVTTNLGENIDRAFQRRMDVVVPFFPPQVAERRQILELHLPADHVVPADFLDLIARRCPLSGGQIRNACLHATLLAVDEQCVVMPPHLEAGLRSEHRKAGGTFPLDGRNNSHFDHGGLQQFISSLSRN